LLAVSSGVLSLLTIFWHDWIESVFNWDPDHNNGAFEWIIVVALVAASIGFGALVRIDWRRRRLTPSR
jgi:hypothetical protein